MLRLTRPLLQATKLSTGIVGLKVHPNPLPELTKVYEDTLTLLAKLPDYSVYRQGTEALTRHKLSVVQKANGDIAEVEKGLDEGQIEESLMIANDEFELVDKMAEWKAWEPLEEKPEPGQWEYFGKQSNAV
ncbi:NADH2 dehydrogenase [Vararia minispora EC-137]|uniref:NADH2 dehydrogenase n=1 Tax=Vararia minispora EC-137 TaxID=1314806 RepID=A0ACB8QN54_9AGAM|nr:NADH2 dehydrogenase [Vararia minispora EC-137]